AEARSKGIPVIYVCDTHRPDDEDFRDWPVHALEGTPGADPWPDLAPEKGDHLIRKRTYSAFTGSELSPLLDDPCPHQILPSRRRDHAPRLSQGDRRVRHRARRPPARVRGDDPAGRTGGRERDRGEGDVALSRADAAFRATLSIPEVASAQSARQGVRPRILG